MSPAGVGSQSSDTELPLGLKASFAVRRASLAKGDSWSSDMVVASRLKDGGEVRAGPKVGSGRGPKVDASEAVGIPGKAEKPVKIRSPRAYVT